MLISTCSYTNAISASSKKRILAVGHARRSIRVTITDRLEPLPGQGMSGSRRRRLGWTLGGSPGTMGVSTG